MLKTGPKSFTCIILFNPYIVVCIRLLALILSLRTLKVWYTMTASRANGLDRIHTQKSQENKQTSSNKDLSITLSVIALPSSLHSHLLKQALTSLGGSPSLPLLSLHCSVRSPLQAWAPSPSPFSHQGHRWPPFTESSRHCPVLFEFHIVYHSCL